MCHFCVYCEIIELPNGSRMYIHYNSLFLPNYIEFNDDATHTYLRFIPENRMIDGGQGIRLSSNWIDLFRDNDEELLGQ